MTNELFVLLLLFICGLMMVWGFRVLPRNGWQMLATLPVQPLGNGQWQGKNLTWYGLLTANAYLAALSILVILLGAAGVPLSGVLLLALLMLAVCVPASRLMAQLIEGKAHTFTVGGAVFVGIIAAPWMVQLVNFVGGFETPVLTTLAAISIAYAFGEGLGRLACISFGCCYGKPVKNCRPLLRSFFRHWNFSFYEETRKISYASHLEGEPVIPIQAITAILYVGSGLIGTYLFLRGASDIAFALMIAITQGWRVLSETQRADYRGGTKISAYQVMGLLGIPYALLCLALFPLQGIEMHLGAGLDAFWQPGTLFFLQLVGLLIFIYTGRSTVTGAHVSFHVHHDQV